MLHPATLGTPNGFACPTPPRTEQKNVEQPIAIVTHRRLEVNPKAYPAWMPDLCGHAVLAGNSAVHYFGGPIQCIHLSAVEPHQRANRFDSGDGIVV